MTSTTISRGTLVLLLAMVAGTAWTGSGAHAAPLATGYAWAEKAGWIHINQPAPPAPDVAAAEATYLRGFLWGKAAGWIHLGVGPAKGLSYSNATAADQGVNIGAAGRLSGFAWSEKLGAIDFNVEPGIFLSAGGHLSGRAWSRTAGWVTFGIGDVPERVRELCDPANPSRTCPYPNCACVDDTLELTFDGDSQSVLEYDVLPQEVEATVVMDTRSQGVQGWSYGVAHDPGYLRVTSVTIDGTDTGSLVDRGFVVNEYQRVQTCGPDPQCLDSDRTDGGGWVAAIILSIVVPVVLPVERSSLARASYDVLADPGTTGTLLRFTDRLVIRGSPPTALHIAINGKTRQWSTVIDGWLKRRGPPEEPPISIALFSDSDGDLLHDPGEESATTSVGGEVRFLADFTNTGAEAVTVTPTLDGLAASWFEPLEPFVLLAGEGRRQSIVVRVPESASAGSYSLILRAETVQGTAIASGQLEVLGVPLISDLLPPGGIVTARRSVTVSWRTSAETTGRVYLTNLETGAEKSQTSSPEYSREHRVAFEGLDLGALYEWWVESAGRWGGRAVGPSDPQNPGAPIPRRFLVGNGVVFTQQEYARDVERDYNQIVELGIENISDETRDVVLRLENPYPDVAIGFVGTGSIEEPAVLRGGETKPVDLGVHLQDAEPSRTTPYLFTAELRSTRGGASVVVDTALVRVTVTTPDVRFTVDEVGGPDPCSLSKTFRVTNAGDTVTDLKVRLSEALAGRVAVVPSITSATVPSGGTLDFQLVPVGPLAQTFTGTVDVSGAGRTESRAVALVPPVGRTFRTVRLEDILLCVESADSGCLNRKRISIPLEIPSTVQRESIRSATLYLTFAPRSENAAVTYRLTLSLNGRELELLDRPVGDYSFEVPLDALRVSGDQTSVNTVTLTVSGFNAGSYYIASNALLCVCLSEYECGAYAANDPGAVNCCLGRPGVRATPVGNLAADVVVEPERVVEGEEARIRATVRSNGVAAEGLVVTLRTSDGQRSWGLAEVSPGVYEGTWTSSCAGDVTLEVHVAACPGGVIASKVVRVESGLEQILSVPYYDSEGTAWDWAGAMSGILRYHGYGVKPWTIAAALGAEPSQGLDLREAGTDLREPSLNSLLAYLRSGLGVLPGVKKYSSAEAGNLSCELRGKIQEGHPIWLAYGNSTTGDAEVLLVVGASGDTVVVHELGGAGRLRDPLSEAALTGRLFSTPESVVVAVEFLSVAPGEGTGLSLSLPPRVPAATSGGLRIVHRAGTEELKVLWHGGMSLGYLLSNPGNDPGDSSQWMPPASVFPEEAATGWSPLVGDELELGVEVANAGAESRDVKVEATLEHLRSGRRVERVSAVETIGSGESNGVVDVFGEGNRRLLEPQGNYELRARLVHDGEVVDSLSVPFRVRCPEGVSFVRGDVGRRGFESKPVPADELVNITDAIAILSWLFLEGGQTELDCAKAADTSDDGVINITDAVYLLSFLFLGGKEPPAPHPVGGGDLTPDDLECCQYPQKER